MTTSPQQYLNFLSYLTVVFDKVDEQITLIAASGDDYQVAMANEAFARWVSRPAEAIRGKALGDVMPNAVLDALRSHYQIVYETRQQQTTRYAWPDGRILNLVSHPILDALDEPVYVASIASDVTELELERGRRVELEAEAMLYQAVASEIVLAVSPDGTIEQATGGTGRFGLEPSELRARNISVVFTLPEGQSFDEVISALPANGRATSTQALLTSAAEPLAVRCTLRRERVKSSAQPRIVVLIALAS